MLQKIFKATLGLTIALIPLYVVRFKIGPIPTTLLEILIYFSFILFLISGAQSAIKNKTPLSLGALFVFAGLLGALLDPHLGAGLGLWKSYFFDGYLLLVMILSIKKDEIAGVLNFLIAGGLLTTLMSFYLYSHGIKTEDNRLLDFAILSPNYLAMYLVPILIISISQMVKFFKKSRVYLIYLLSAIILTYALYLTGSRGGYIAALSGLIVILFSHFATGKKKKLVKIGLWVGLAILLVVTVWAFRPDWSSHGRKATSSNIRYYIWTTSIEMIGREPVFGVGLSNYQGYFSTLTQDRVNFPEFITPEALTAHNLYLEIYLTCGLLGLITFIIFLLNSKFYQIRNIALCAAMISILIFGFFDTPFFRNDLSAIFWVLIALVYSVSLAKQTN